MDSQLDLRNVSREDYRERLFARLDELERDDSIEVVAEPPAEVALYHYQIKRDRSIEWETEATEPWTTRVRKSAPLDEDEYCEFDVREMPPQRRHEVLLDTFDDLEPGEGFVLVNDHDPKPLYHELRSTRGETFEWEYRSRESQEWKVEIVKTEHSTASDDGVITKFDVRTIPKQERHPTIHHRYGMIPEGGTMEIVAPHEPRPLHQEFGQRYGESFTWEVVEREPGQCRVQITKAGATRGDAAATEGDAAATDAGPGDDHDRLDITKELDVRGLAPAQRHEQIYAEYDSLQLGEAFVLVNDHDPKPLYHQFQAEAGDEFSWEYQQREPEEFRVVIGKSEATGDEADVDEGSTAPF